MLDIIRSILTKSLLGLVLLPLFLISSLDQPLWAAKKIDKKSHAPVIIVFGSSSNINIKNEKDLLFCTLVLMVDGSSGQIVIQNISTKTANNIVSNLAQTSLAGSVDEVRSGCDTVLTNGTCTFTYTPHSSTAPPTTITFKGTNTRAITSMIAISDKPQLLITAPLQQERVVPVGGGSFDLQVKNNPSSVFDAIGIDVTNKAACPGLVVDTTNCQSLEPLPPGSSCLLSLSSPAPLGYPPCTITVGGTNTANDPTALIAFSYLGGLVYAPGKIVSDPLVDEWSWITSAVFTGAQSTTDGFGNTTLIYNTFNCSSGTCAARLCTFVNPPGAWYLPAVDELTDILNALCGNNSLPCNFGNFSGKYWSSTQDIASIIFATSFVFPTGATSTIEPIGAALKIRCSITF